MSGPIVRIGSTPEFSAAWDKIFGGDDKAAAPAGKKAAKKPAKKAPAAKKAAKKTAKKKAKKK